jgi:hypothetical protein
VHTRRLFLLALLLPALAAAGCQPDVEVKSYVVQHPDREKLLMLAAIIPHGEKTWFVRLSGPEQAVGAQRKAFDQFIGSLRFDDKNDPPLSWTAPDGWKEQKGGMMALAAFRIDAEPQPLETTVTALGKLDKGNSLLANINRWRGQLLLPPIGEDELEQSVRREKVDGQEVIRTDLAGLGVARAPTRPPMAVQGGGPAAQPPAAGPALPFRYEVPAGWDKQKKPAGMSVVSYEVADGASRAEITITALPGKAGGEVQNIVRWRGQVGLPPAKEADVLKDTRSMTVAGTQATYVDLTGPKGAIVAVMLPLPQTTWFVKMSGPPELVARQKANFEAFVKSFQLDNE